MFDLFLLEITVQRSVDVHKHFNPFSPFIRLSFRLITVLDLVVVTDPIFVIVVAAAVIVVLGPFKKFNLISYTDNPLLPNAYLTPVGWMSVHPSVRHCPRSVAVPIVNQ